MTKNILIGALLVALGAGGAYVYLATARRSPPGESAAQPQTSAFCAKHQIAEAECPWCTPSLIEAGGTCPEHGLPEALCSRCNSRLIAGFKAENDWCGGHNVPESQCALCGGSCTTGEAQPAADKK